MTNIMMGVYLVVLAAACWLVAPGARTVEAKVMEGLAHAWSNSDANGSRFGTTMGEIAFYALRVFAVVAAGWGAWLLVLGR